MKGFLFIIFMALATNAIASSTFTKEQLNLMVSSGQNPEQEPPVTKSVESISLASCELSARSVYNQVADSYPAKIIVDTDDLFVVKIWTNDGVILVSCSGPDNKKIVTQSSYK